MYICFGSLVSAMMHHLLYSGTYWSALIILFADMRFVKRGGVLEARLSNHTRYLRILKSMMRWLPLESTMTSFTWCAECIFSRKHLLRHAHSRAHMHARTPRRNYFHQWDRVTGLYCNNDAHETLRILFTIMAPSPSNDGMILVFYPKWKAAPFLII